MWIALTLLSLIGLTTVHYLWRRRCAELCRELDAQARHLEALQAGHALELRRVRSEQRGLLDSMTEAVLVLDRASRVQSFNASLEGLFRIQSDIQGRTVVEAFLLPELTELVERLAHEGRVLGHELRLPGPPLRFVEVNAASIADADGQPQGAVLVFHDLTRLKQLEETRKEFVANVSHELRTPLSLIKGFVETLLDGAKSDPAVAEQFLRTIAKHTDRLTFLIEDLLTLSRIESGQVVLNLQPVVLAEIVERVLESLRTRAAEKQTRLECQVPPTVTVCVDANRIEQALFNLVDNAVKYGRRAGLVTVGATETAGRQPVELWVRDDGPGIPVEAQSRVFERFYRVDRARSRESGGTGLGLAIVKHIVQLHRGDVWVESEPGNGATFRVRLPQGSAT
jgi:two-component system phosphate regulon sensor histidine kinase PhoR